MSKPSSEILQLGNTFRFQIFHVGKRFISEAYTSRWAAEVGLREHLEQREGLKPNPRLAQLLNDFGLSCCRMAYKLTYCSGLSLEKVSEMLGLSEDQAEQASQAGEYSLRGRGEGRLSKTEAEKIIDAFFNYEGDEYGQSDF